MWRETRSSPWRGKAILSEWNSAETRSKFLTCSLPAIQLSSMYTTTIPKRLRRFKVMQTQQWAGQPSRRACKNFGRLNQSIWTKVAYPVSRSKIRRQALQTLTFWGLCIYPTRRWGKLGVKMTGLSLLYRHSEPNLKESWCNYETKNRRLKKPSVTST